MTTMYRPQVELVLVVTVTKVLIVSDAGASFDSFVAAARHCFSGN